MTLVTNTFIEQFDAPTMLTSLCWLTGLHQYAIVQYLVDCQFADGKLIECVDRVMRKLLTYEHLDCAFYEGKV